MSELTPPPAWTSAAVCAQTDPEEFFPESGGRIGIAKSICNGHPGNDRTRYREPCPVKEQCLQWALDTEEQHGVYGGVSAHERRKMLRARRAEEVSDAA